jgi:hypothetical protein
VGSGVIDKEKKGWFMKRENRHNSGCHLN